MPTNSLRGEHSIQESADNFSSPDIWDNTVNILETSQGILSTSDIFEVSDSGEDELIPNTSTPEAFLSEESSDGNSVKSLNLENHSFEINSLTMIWHFHRETQYLQKKVHLKRHLQLDS